MEVHYVEMHYVHYVMFKNVRARARALTRAHTHTHTYTHTHTRNLGNANTDRNFQVL